MTLCTRQMFSGTILSDSLQAALTKCHRLGALNNRHSFILDLDAVKFKIRVPAWLGPGKIPLPAFSLHPHLQRETSFLNSSSKGTNPIMRATSS